jgi:hypothetical protein
VLTGVNATGVGCITYDGTHFGVAGYGGISVWNTVSAWVNGIKAQAKAIKGFDAFDAAKKLASLKTILSSLVSGQIGFLYSDANYSVLDLKGKFVLEQTISKRVVYTRSEIGFYNDKGVYGLIDTGTVGLNWPGTSNIPACQVEVHSALLW